MNDEQIKNHEQEIRDWETTHIYKGKIVAYYWNGKPITIERLKR